MLDHLFFVHGKDNSFEAEQRLDGLQLIQQQVGEQEDTLSMQTLLELSNRKRRR